jgi:hypothetical protein
MRTSCIGIFGIDIQIGDFVTYPGRGGSNIWMRCGFVVGISPTNIKIARGIKYRTYDVLCDTYTTTQYFSHTYTITNTHLVAKLTFASTQYNNPTHDEYTIYQEILRDIHKDKCKLEN